MPTPMEYFEQLAIAHDLSIATVVEEFRISLLDTLPHADAEEIEMGIKNGRMELRFRKTAKHAPDMGGEGATHAISALVDVEKLPTVYSALHKVFSERLEFAVLQKSFLASKQKEKSIVFGVVQRKTANGYFVHTGVGQGFMPYRFSIESEQKAGIYATGSRLAFYVQNVSLGKKKKVEIQLSRISRKLNFFHVNGIFSKFGVICSNIRRKPGVYVKFYIDAKPSKELTAELRKAFVSERIIYRKA